MHFKIAAWIRLWAFNNETPKKFKNENNRWEWPFRFKLLPVTQTQCLPDDIALYPASVVEELWAENNKLRAMVANGGGDCAYCSLPRAEWSTCASGFPGCARADDALLCPHVGASMVDLADAERYRWLCAGNWELLLSQYFYGAPSDKKEHVDETIDQLRIPGDEL